MKQSSAFDDEPQFTIEIGDRGRLVLPSLVRRQLGLEKGDELILTVAEDSIIKLSSRKHLAAKFRGRYKHLSSKASMVDELIAQRKKEATSE
jgi:AbrB family looped-hinge helix DNA binding protein